MVIKFSLCFKGTSSLSVLIYSLQIQDKYKGINIVQFLLMY